jgi:hypothetical protein
VICFFEDTATGNTRPARHPPIKQVDLFSKYRALIPVQFQEETCPDPGEDIKGSIKRERNTKQQDHQKAKRMKSENNKKTTTSKERGYCNNDLGRKN